MNYLAHYFMQDLAVETLEKVVCHWKSRKKVKEIDWKTHQNDDAGSHFGT